MFSECAGLARDFAKVVDQVRFLARALAVDDRNPKRGVERCDTNTMTNDTTKHTAFEPMSKRRRGYPSETKVKRGVGRIIRFKATIGQLEEKLGRNDSLCPCGSGAAVDKRCCLDRSGRLCMASTATTTGGLQRRYAMETTEQVNTLAWQTPIRASLPQNAGARWHSGGRLQPGLSGFDSHQRF